MEATSADVPAPEAGKPQHLPEVAGDVLGTLHQQLCHGALRFDMVWVTLCECSVLEPLQL